MLGRAVAFPWYGLRALPDRKYLHDVCRSGQRGCGQLRDQPEQPELHDHFRLHGRGIWRHLRGPRSCLQQERESRSVHHQGLPGVDLGIRRRLYGGVPHAVDWTLQAEEREDYAGDCYWLLGWLRWLSCLWRRAEHHGHRATGCHSRTGQR